MNFVVTLDWKFVVALGAVVVGTIFAVKMGPEAIEKVSTELVDTMRDYIAADNCDY